MASCPCGSTNSYADCCEPIITGSRTAETAEQQMRARYSAYTRIAMDFIFESTHPDSRTDYDPAGTKAWAENSEWLGLQIINTNKGGKDDVSGEVEFIAHFRENGTLREHHENATFKKQDGVWFFSDGAMVKPKPLTVTKVGRNDPCPCGSGLKYKKCCGK